MATFKLLPREQYSALSGDHAKRQRSSLNIGPGQKRVFKIDFSRYEYTASRQEHDLAGDTIYVYTPEMIVAEKIRAICQQMPEYALGRRTRTARARDFYDIHAVVHELGIDSSTQSFHELVRAMFEAKGVPLDLIEFIPRTRDFHFSDWPAVQAAANAPHDFDYYFDYVEIQVLPGLKPLWHKQSP